MAWQTPTLTEIKERLQADLQARLPGSQPQLRRSLGGIIADIDAGTMQGLYGYLDWMARQIIPDTADDDMLERWADVWGIKRDKGAKAAGSLVITGTNGTVFPTDAVWQSQDGIEYVTTAGGTIVSDTATIQVQASEIGETGNQVNGDQLTLVSAIPGIDSIGTVDTDGITGGTDLETIERLRERLLSRIQQPPHGGAKGDYESWALEAHPDVTRAWVFPNELGVGTVTIRVVCDNLEDPIPTTAVLDAVAAYIEERRPVTAEVYVVAPIAVPLDLTISINPDTPAVRALIEAAIPDYLANYAVPGGTLYLSQLNGTIYVAAGESVHNLVSPVADINYAAGEVAVMGAITWA